ncbi:MAG: hypothetical protein WEA58_04120 [Balneolaceae bacterium]
MAKSKKINIKVGQNAVFVDQNGNECAALINAVLPENKVSLHYFPSGITQAAFHSGVKHYNDADKGEKHWKKA